MENEIVDQTDEHVIKIEKDIKNHKDFKNGFIMLKPSYLR